MKSKGERYEATAIVKAISPENLVIEEAMIHGMFLLIYKREKMVIV